MRRTQQRPRCLPVLLSLPLKENYTLLVQSKLQLDQVSPVAISALRNQNLITEKTAKGRDSSHPGTPTLSVPVSIVKVTFKLGLTLYLCSF